MGTHATEPAVKNHISPEMARELIAIYQTMYHLWFLVYQRVLPQLHFHLLLNHLHDRIPCLMSTDTPIIQYQKQKEVEVRVKSFGETRCMNPQKPKTKIKMVNQKKYQENWLMKVLQQSPWRIPEQGSQDTSKSSHELPKEPQAKVEPGFCKQSVYTHFPKDPNCDICLKTKITRSSCRRRTGTVVPERNIFVT